MARTSGSASSSAKTSGSSAQNAGPMALPLPGPSSVTCATCSLVSTERDSYVSAMRATLLIMNELQSSAAALNVLRGVLGGIDATDLDNPTPCSEYDVSALTDHL